MLVVQEREKLFSVGKGKRGGLPIEEAGQWGRRCVKLMPLVLWVFSFCPVFWVLGMDVHCIISLISVMGSSRVSSVKAKIDNAPADQAQRPFGSKKPSKECLTASWSSGPKSSKRTNNRTSSKLWFETHGWTHWWTLRTPGL